MALVEVPVAEAEVEAEAEARVSIVKAVLWVAMTAPTAGMALTAETDLMVAVVQAAPTAKRGQQARMLSRWVHNATAKLSVSQCRS